MECLNSVSSALLREPNVYRWSEKETFAWFPLVGFKVRPENAGADQTRSRVVWRNLALVGVGGGLYLYYITLDPPRCSQHLCLKCLKCFSPCSLPCTDLNNATLVNSEHSRRSAAVLSPFCAQQPKPPNFNAQMHKLANKSLRICSVLTCDLLLCVVCLAIVFNQLYPKSNQAYSSNP